jgi:hypothetical protein
MAPGKSSKLKPFDFPNCPFCGSLKSIVITTWRGGVLWRRRRRCCDCGKDFSTAQPAEFVCDKRGFAVYGKNLHCAVKNE